MNSKNKLVTALREGVGVVQMLLYKEIREHLTSPTCRHKETEESMLAGAIIGEIFAAKNQEEKFVSFRENHQAKIEQELLDLKQNIPELIDTLTDALRIQVLCDYHENSDSTALLKQAQSYGYLVEEREIPLPSTFMSNIRDMGKRYNLITPPLNISKEEDDLFR